MVSEKPGELNASSIRTNSVEHPGIDLARAIVRYLLNNPALITASEKMTGAIYNITIAPVTLHLPKVINYSV